MEQTVEYPWFSEYKICRIPETLEPYPDEPTHYLVDYAAEHFPKMGCVQLGLEMPYGEVKEAAEKLANALAAMGIKKGDCMATMLPTSIQFVLADTAISKAGAVHVPCSFLDSVENLAHKFSECSPKAIICMDEHAHLAEPLKDYMGGGKDILVSNLYDFSAKLPQKSSAPGAQNLLDVIDQAKAEPPVIKFNPSRDLETLLFTGGTTGIAKGVMLTHLNVISNARQNAVVMGPVGDVFKGNLSVMMANPFFHAYGHCLFHTMTERCFNLLLLTDPRDVKMLKEMAQEYHPVLQVGVPTQYMNLLGEDMKKCKVIGISGSAPLRPNVQEEFEKKGSGVVTEGYGLSEVVSVSHYNVSTLIRLMGGRKSMWFMNRTLFSRPGVAFQRFLAKLSGPKRYGKFFMGLVSLNSNITRRLKAVKKVERRATIGIPLPDTEIRVLDLETDEPIPFDQLINEEKTGELAIRGPQAMLGYWPDEGKGLDEEGFVHTGDVVKMDKNGYFSIVDRTKDMVIVSGFKVYTREVDDVLHEHPATEVAATIGVPDPARPGSERVVVFIQIKEEHKGKVTEEEYIEFLRSKVAKYAVPKSVVFLDEIPLTTMFKVRKNELRDIAVEKL
jgi:acyl-CoA synthetase (AMP-forming)/AMP-acid ligase II